LTFVYFVMVERLDEDQRSELDQFLAGERQRRDPALLAQLGGEVVS
jgi:hypothetical protein